MVIVQYNKITPENRTLVRSIESKSYVGYIRYLLLKRWPFERVRKELMRLGLSWHEQEGFLIYFKEVIYPVMQQMKIARYYKRYKAGMKDEPLTYQHTFGQSEKDRISFVDALKHLEVEQFFAEEIVEFYGGIVNIPDHPITCEPILVREKPIDLVDLLQNPKRHEIEQLLVEGYSPKQISSHLNQRYDMELSATEIKTYAKSFFNVKRQDIQRLIENLQAEKEALEVKLLEVKRQPASSFSFGERFEIISTLSRKVEQISTMIRKVSGVHSGAMYNAAVLEVTDMREMFQDVAVRTYRRFREMDERTEDEVVGSLKSITEMMVKATGSILSIDEVLGKKQTKSINEEMLEVIMPTLDRIEEEERENMFSYKQAGKNEDDDDDEIIGLD